MNDAPIVRLSIPEPEFRPGDEPDYSDVKIPEAGVVTLPPLDVEPRLLRNHAFSIIRILRRDGEAVGPWATMLPDDELVAGLKRMITLRILDARMIAAQRQGKTSFYVPQLGEEGVAIAFQTALSKGDMNFPTYRTAGLLIAQDYPLEAMLNQIFSNKNDPLSGRQMPVLYSAKDYGFFTVSGNLGTQFVQAVGWAMAAALDGSDKIAAGWIGDGSTAESDFHSAMVFASTYKPPVVLNIVNNQWAISTFQGIAKGESGTFAARALGFGMAALRVDGNDFLAVHAVARWAVKRARMGLGPTIIEHVTYRAGGHSTSDNPDAYRPKAESDAWPLGDPIERLKLHLIKRGLWSEERHTQALAEIRDTVVTAQKAAEKHGTLISGHSAQRRGIFDGLYAETPLHLERQRKAAEKWL